jgi:hypothetical protein
VKFTTTISPWKSYLPFRLSKCFVNLDRIQSHDNVINKKIQRWSQYKQKLLFHSHIFRQTAR